MEMFLLAWLADQVLTGGLQQLVKAIKQSDADKIVERTVRHVRDGLAGEAGSDRSLVDRLTAWLDDLLRARRSVVRRGSSTPMGQDEASEALIAHLRQAAEQSELELPSGERAPVGNVMAALGMDLDGLADRVMTASRTALNEVAALAGGASEVRAQRDAETARRTLESVDGTLRETGQGVQRTEQIVGGIQQDVRALVDRGDRSAPTAGTDPVDRLALSAAGSMPLPAPALRRRPELLRKLRRLGGRKTRDVGAVIGPPGVGKTQLVAAYARERAAKGWPVVWITAESQEQVITGYADLADVLGLRPAGEDSRTAADRAFRWLCGRSEPCLLVLDNATDPQVVRPWLPPGVGATRCVVTSTRQVFGSLGVKVDVAVFAPDEARAFLRDRLDVADPDGEKRLVTELGRHPLGLALAAAVVERRGWSYDTYLEAFGGRPVAEALRADLEGDPYPRGIQQAIGLSMDAAAPAGSEPRRLLELVAVLAPAGAAISLLATGDSEVHDAVGDLVDASLVSRSEDGASVVVHRLTARVVREFAADAGALDTAIATATELVRGRLWPIAGSWNARHEADPLVDHTESLLALVGPIEHEDPAVGAPRSVGHVDLAARVVRHLIEVHDPTRAIPLGRIVLDACTTMSGECRDTMISRGDLARAHELVGRSGEAIALHEMNLATCVRAFGEDHLDASILRNNLAEAYESVGRLDEAIALYELDLVARNGMCLRCC